jgi:hypothetical protein
VTPWKHVAIVVRAYFKTGWGGPAIGNLLITTELDLAPAQA